MKRTTLFIVVFVVLASFAFASQVIEYDDSWSNAGFSIEQRNGSGVTVNYSIKEFSLTDIRIEGENMVNVLLPDVMLQNNEGAPNLAGGGRLIALPQGAYAKLNIISKRTETFSNIEIAPAPRIPLDTDDSPLEYSRNQTVYSKDAFYPASPVTLGEQTQMRGVDVVMLGITPFQYNPVTKELIVYRDLQVEVEFVGGNGHFGADNLRSRWWDPILSDHILNYESLPVIDYSSNSRTRDGAEYLIICPDDADFLAWADSIKVFRTQQGISTIVMTTAEVGGNTVSAIEGYIDDIMDPTTGWDPAPAAILLLGDYGTTGNTIVSPIYNNYCVSDNIYADVSGNMMPDVTLARMTAQNAAQLEIMITKFLDYERNPPTDPDFYDHPITALGYQTERWFQICSESVAGFWEVNQGKTVNRINAIYSGSPTTGPWSTATNTATVLSVFGPDGLGYIPATPGQVNCTWYGNANDVINGLNDGAFMLQHRDHGSTTGWGEPGFQSSHINSLTNTDLTYIFSINCLTGKYNLAGECFAETFHRYTYNGENSGALGILAASEVSYSFVNDTFVWGMYDNMWPDFLPTYNSTPVERGVLPAFANSAGKYFLQQSSWPYNTNNKAVTYALFHHHGDAFTTVYSEVPQDLTVVHDPVLLSGFPTFTVTADAGALIALSVEGELIGIAEGTGAPIDITIDPQLPPANVDIVITKQNYYRYEAQIMVTPSDGPYITFESYLIDDTSTGNGNGTLENGEIVDIDMSVENLGTEQGTNVIITITTADPYITIIDGTENFGNIPAESIVTVAGAFTIEAAGDMPDSHMVYFELEAVAEDTWISNFSLEAFAPMFPPENLTSDIQNYNDIVLTWEQPSGTEITRDLLGYKIYKEGLEITEINDPAILTYTDAILPSGVYEYHITALFHVGESDPSNIETVTLILPVPQNPEAATQYANIIISWDEPADRSFSHYKVYRNLSMIADDIMETSYIDPDVPNGTYSYNVRAVYSGDYQSALSSDALIEHVQTNIDEIMVPVKTELTGNFPNPFNPTTTISFSTREAGQVSISIYNMKGQLVKTLVNEHLEAAYHSAVWNGKDNSNKTVSSGIYFYKMRSSNYTATKKMILMK